MNNFEITVRGTIYFGEYDIDRKGDIELSGVKYSDEDGEEYQVTGKELLFDIKREVEKDYEDELNEMRDENDQQQKENAMEARYEAIKEMKGL